MKSIALLIAYFCFFQIFPQENSNKIKFHSIAFSFPNIYADNGDGGVSLNIETGVYKGKHIFKFSGFSGSEVQISVWGPSSSTSFSALDLLYGREFEQKEWLYLDLFAGIGYFSETFHTPEGLDGSSDIKNTSSTIDFPIQSKIRFKTGDKFSLGLQMHLNINPVNTISNFGLFYQWNFNYHD